MHFDNENYITFITALKAYKYKMLSDQRNNHITCTTNLEKEHYMQGRANLENDQMMMNCTSCSNASSKIIASNVDML